MQEAKAEEKRARDEEKKKKLEQKQAEKDAKEQERKRLKAEAAAAEEVRFFVVCVSACARHFFSTRVLAVTSASVRTNCSRRGLLLLFTHPALP